MAEQPSSSSVTTKENAGSDQTNDNTPPPSLEKEEDEASSHKPSDQEQEQHHHHSKNTNKLSLERYTKGVLAVPVNATKGGLRYVTKTISKKKKKKHRHEEDDNQHEHDDNEHAQQHETTKSKASATSKAAGRRENKISSAGGIRDDKSVVDDTDTAHDEKTTSTKFAVGKARSGLLDFVTKDTGATMLVSTMVVSFYQTYAQRTLLSWEQIPSSVALCWFLVAYCAGQTFSLSRWMTSKSGGTQVDAVPQPTAAKPKAMVPEPSTMLSRATTASISSSTGSHGMLQSFPPLTFINVQTEKMLHWQKKCDPTKGSINPTLMKKLLDNHRFERICKTQIKKRRKKKKMAHQSVQLGESHEEKEQQGDEPTTPDSTRMGSFELSGADSLDEYVIEPLLGLRGLDIFLAHAAPETDIAEHPWLVQHGLRDVPTCIVNVMTQWGNILLYFEMPSWVESWDDIHEQESDSDAVKALKRFMNGTDEYRNERLFLVPSVVEAPLAVRVLAPPKKELLIRSSFLPVSWKKHHQGTTSDGRKKCVAIETNLDLLSNSLMRSMAGIVKKHLHALAIDVAVTIGKENEPQACLGLLRFDHIEIASCPYMPDRFSDEAEMQGHTEDVIRATKIMCMSMSDVNNIAKSM